MGFISSLFGGVGGDIWTVVTALAIVLLLIVLLVWVLKFVLNASRSVGSGRTRRIEVSEAVMVDGKRRLVLVRRDDREHLILTGGAQDLIVESDIPLPDYATSSAPQRQSRLNMAPIGQIARRQTAPAGQAMPEPRVARPEPGPEPGAELGPADAPSEAPEEPQTTSRPPIPGLRRRSEATSNAVGRNDPPPRHNGSGGPDNTEAESLERAARPAAADETSPMEKLRQLGRRSPPRNGTAALRYPGLLRPVTRHSAVPPQFVRNKAEANPADSDMSDADETPSAQGGDAVDEVRGKSAKAKPGKSRKG
ncbi:flagellar biosynthetic protein FliO [Cucumibacter marinus]|uniref:flagellar biosynthetic protein FliO n=1 Tax=Cucumibacter marinus TaxID=1121252 RepID=UPI00042539C7|nr:flagellar biosynthetic protein FliO [Cucumibacter marinus]